jgi:phosphoesterase RecJ-like protein
MAERENYIAARNLIEKSQRILISGHISPDGDALGSMIALSRALTAAGKQAFATADIGSLGRLTFMQGVKELIPLKKLKRKKFDLFIYVDCGAIDRIPVEVRPFAEKLPTITIDHHRTSEPAGVAIVDADAPAASEIVWRFLKWMEWPIDNVIAEALWVGLITDSGKFAYDATSSKTMRVASDLLKHNVRTQEINDILYCSFSSKAIELKRRAWRSLHIWKNRKVAEVTLSRDDFRDVRGKKADAEDVIEIPRQVARNEIALFFHQIPDRTKETRVSIRTRGQWDASILAMKFGGGGHLRAAGCTIQGSMAQAKRLMRKAVREILTEAKN